jgi:hypothetical protein
MRAVLFGVPQRVTAVIVISLVVTFGAGLPAGLVKADESSTQTLNQNEIGVTGTATSSVGVAALAGPAIANAHAVVQQHNVQVATGDPTALANSSQDATNTATVNQTTAAVTGDATSTNGGTATSGYAAAQALAVVLQLNVQVMALLSEDCVVEQVATNDAQIDQTAASMSGSATADGATSDAATGDARSSTRNVSVQRNVQVYVCKGETMSSQEAANAIAAAQEAAALTGNADSTSGSDTSSGNATSKVSESQSQVNHQIVIE